MPKITVNLFATLRRHIDGAPSVDVEIEPGQTVEQVLRRLDIEPEQARILFVDSRIAKTSQRLQGGETVSVFPAIGGG